MEKPLFNRDLINNPKKYSMDILAKNMTTLSKTTILHTQIVDADFCAKYILDVDIDSGSEESYLFEQDVLEAQPHIIEGELYEAVKFYDAIRKKKHI